MERYLLGGLSEERIREVEKQIKENPRIREVLMRLKRSNEEILKQLSPEEMIPKILHRYDLGQKHGEGSQIKRPDFQKRLILVSSAAAVLACLFVIINYKDIFHSKKSGGFLDTTRIKGIEDTDMSQTHLTIYRKMKDSFELLQDGAKVTEGDIIQIAYVAAGELNGIILSLDGNGVVTLHYPHNMSGPTLLVQEKKILLQNAYVLDDAPQFERFFFISSKEKINVAEILTEAEIFAKDSIRAQTKDIKLKYKLSQHSILLVKETGHEK